MEQTSIACCLLCIVGFLKEVRPSEFFVTEYLIGWKNVTVEEVYQVIFPVWPYSYLALLVVVFLVTDFLLYKPIIIFEGLCFIGTWCLLLWGQGIPAMQGVEFLYAAATASQVAYNTYIYAQVPLERFQIVTAYTQSAVLVGRCFAGVLGQILVNTGLCDFSSLNYISLGFVTVSTLVACFLPKVSQSVYFHRSNDKKLDTRLLDVKHNQEENGKSIPDANNSLPLPDIHFNEQTNPTDTRLGQLKIAYQRLWTDLLTSFSSSHMLKWSLWWAFATCGYFQVSNFIQSLWETITPWETTTNTTATPQIYNGAVEAVHTLLGALATIGIGYVPVNWVLYGEATMAAISLFEGVMLYLAGTTNSLWVAYITYTAFGVSYNLLITIASSEVAKELRQESYGLVFGIITFVALFFQTILTLIVSDKIGLALPINIQFQIYGGYYFVLGGIFFAITISSVIIRLRRR